jgi:hypothetical protein
LPASWLTGWLVGCLAEGILLSVMQLLTCTPLGLQLAKPALSLCDLSTRDIQALDKPHLWV